MPLETAKSEKENRPARTDHRSCSFIQPFHSVIQQTPPPPTPRHLVCADSAINLGGSNSEQNEVSVLLELMF